MAFAVILVAGAAPAAPIVIIDSRHTLASAEATCALYPEPTAVAVCHSVDDPRKLGRDLEEKIVSQFALTAQCRGVAVALLLDPTYDGAFSQGAIGLMQKDYWSLLVDYAPVGDRYGWVLFAQALALPGNTAVSSIKPREPRTVDGMGTVPQIAQQVCATVTGRVVR